MAKSIKIGSDYFDMTEFPHGQTTNIIVELYEYSHYDIKFVRDIGKSSYSLRFGLGFFGSSATGTSILTP